MTIQSFAHTIFLEMWAEGKQIVFQLWHAAIRRQEADETRHNLLEIYCNLLKGPE